METPVSQQKHPQQRPQQHPLPPLVPLPSFPLRPLQPPPLVQLPLPPPSLFPLHQPTVLPYYRFSQTSRLKVAAQLKTDSHLHRFISEICNPMPVTLGEILHAIVLHIKYNGLHDQRNSTIVLADDRLQRALVCPVRVFHIEFLPLLVESQLTESLPAELNGFRLAPYDMQIPRELTNEVYGINPFSTWRISKDLYIALQKLGIPTETGDIFLFGALFGRILDYLTDRRRNLSPRNLTIFELDKAHPLCVAFRMKRFSIGQLTTLLYHRCTAHV